MKTAFKDTNIVDFVRQVEKKGKEKKDRVLKRVRMFSEGKKTGRSSKLGCGRGVQAGTKPR